MLPEDAACAMDELGPPLTAARDIFAQHGCKIASSTPLIRVARSVVHVEPACVERTARCGNKHRLGGLA